MSTLREIQLFKPTNTELFAIHLKKTKNILIPRCNKDYFPEKPFYMFQ